MPQPAEYPPRGMVVREFAQSLRRRILPDGIVLANVHMVKPCLEESPMSALASSDKELLNVLCEIHPYYRRCSPFTVEVGAINQ